MDANIVNLLDQAAGQYGVSPDLAVAVAQQESGGNPNAVSSAGAMGVMQLMPATAASLGVSNPFDPAQNIDAGVRYLAQMLAQFGDPTLALAAYNWGPGNVQKHGYNNWPAETSNYVRSILGKLSIAVSTQPPTIDASTGQVVPSENQGPSGMEMFAVAAAVGLLMWVFTSWGS